MRSFRSIPRTLVTLALLGILWTPGTAEEAPSRLDQVLNAIVANEAALAKELEQYRPVVETYLQTVKTDAVAGSVPVKDNYFIGRLEIPRQADVASGGKKKDSKRSKQKALNLFEEFHSATFKPESFARMLTLDRGSFDREHYRFDFIRTEFLGDIRTLVFDVMPKEGKALSQKRTGRFTGRIWVEDQDYNIVRYNGLYASTLIAGFHFDSWRLHMAPNLWLPAYVYTEESEPAFKQIKLTHKGQVRIWGYEVAKEDAEDEFTKVLVDTRETKDQSEAPGHVSPVESVRAWEAEAEENVIRRLERSGLLAPAGEVDKVLETVVSNLEITNSLAIDPPVRCRVLLTTPLESFTVGHTIVLSRGLVDVLPDEASLAMVLAHELGHVLSGHELDTRFAFGDRMLVDDRQAMDQFAFQRLQAEEFQADAKALELLANSPYKDALAGPGLFLKALAANAAQLPSLIRPHFGNAQLHRMTPLLEAAPALDPTSLEQTAALPLGGRVQLDPWSASISLMKGNQVRLMSAREKMPFMVTPLMPHLARLGAKGEPIAGSQGGDVAGASEPLRAPSR